MVYQQYLRKRPIEDHCRNAELKMKKVVLIRLTMESVEYIGESKTGKYLIFRCCEIMHNVSKVLKNRFFFLFKTFSRDVLNLTMRLIGRLVRKNYPLRPLPQPIAYYTRD